MQLEYGNECRVAPSHSFIFKQAIATEQPASIQVVPNCDNQHQFVTSLSNTIGCLKEKKVTMPCRYGYILRTNAGATISQLQCETGNQTQTTRQSQHTLLQRNLGGATKLPPFACPILWACIKFGRQSCTQNVGIHAGSLYITAILQAGTCNAKTYQYANCHNGTDVVQTKHQHAVVQYNRFA